MISTSRIRGILLQPRREWPAIAAEPATTAGLYAGWIAPLAAIGPIATFIGMSIFGFSVPFVGQYRVPIASGLGRAILSYIGALVGVYVLAILIDLLAPMFKGQPNRISALKVAAYGSTAAWIAGIFGLFPPIAILGLVGLYSIYLIYLGLPVLMKSPPERAGGYTAVVVVIAVVIFLVIGMCASLVFRGAGYPGAYPR
jgi:hypothetical protein